MTDSVLLIRADANARMGTGHLMRCLALAQAWQAHDGEAIFITACDSEGPLQRLRDEGFHVFELAKTYPDPDERDVTSQVLATHPEAWVVLDGYHFEPAYQRRMKEAGHPLLVIDDMAHLDHYYADVVLNQNIHAAQLAYSCEPDTRLLLGTEYVLLRREFWPWREWEREIPDVARKVLGTIARIEGETRPEKLIVPKKPLSTIAEAYRVLRTNIRFSFVDRPMDALMVTSPGPGEGKSVTLANLAAVMAQSGLQVIAVDSDLRRPVLHKIFGVSNTEGLSDAVLNPDTEPADYLQETGIENLRLLPSGPLPPNPAELLGSDRMSAVLAALKAESDLLLFDSPPTLVVTDAAVLAAQIDGGLLLVVDAGRSRRGMVKRAAEELRRVRANLLGVIVNRLSVRSGGQYYYQYYYYYSDRYGKNQKRRKDRTGLQRLLPDFLVGSNGKDSAEEPVEEAAKEKS